MKKFSFTFADLLATQDMGEKAILKVTAAIVDSPVMEYGDTDDGLTSYLAKCFKDRLYIDNDAEGFITDMDYAIHQLRKAQAFVRSKMEE